VTSALLAGGSGCTDEKVYTNPGPVRQPAASPTPGSSPAPDAEPATSATPSPEAEIKPEDIMTNPGPDPDGPGGDEPNPR